MVSSKLMIERIYIEIKYRENDLIVNQEVILKIRKKVIQVNRKREFLMV